MSSCKLLYSIDLACGDTMYPAGLDGLLHAGYVQDLATPFSTTMATDITSVQFTAYNGLKRLQGVKYAHLSVIEGQVGAGGNVSLVHRMTLKLITNSTQDDAQILRLMQATDIFFFAKDARGEYKIVGPSGMKYAPGQLQSLGQAATDDVSDTLIFESTEIVKPLRFAPVGVTDITAYLNARVV